jgi:hypothetical protein
MLQGQDCTVPERSIPCQFAAPPGGGSVAATARRGRHRPALALLPADPFLQ